MKILRRLNHIGIGQFEWFYMFVMVIYMAQATTETSRMIQGLSGNPIPLLIPLFLTYILYKKHPISFKNKNLRILLGIYFIWMICSLIKYKTFDVSELSYHIFLIYGILTAYIHVKVFGNKLLPLYEDIMVVFCKIAIAMWLLAVLFPFTASLFEIFPHSVFGNSILYLFTWMSPVNGQYSLGFMRNAGCSWEPGRFAIMVCLAIYCNLSQYGIKFRHNKNIWWLLVTLLTTMSTTGYTTAIIIFTLFLWKKVNMKNILLFICIMLPIFYGLFQLDFMTEKISSKMIAAKDISRWNEMFGYYSENESGDTYLGSIDRFDAMIFEWTNVMHDPIIGYTRNIDYSYFRSKISSNYVLANGLVKIFGMFGLLLGTVFFWVLLVSSKKIAEQNNSKCKFGLFVLFCMSSISYTIIYIPVFFSFWLYGIFINNNKSSNI